MGLELLDDEGIGIADFRLQGNKIPGEKGKQWKNEDTEQREVKDFYGANCPWIKRAQRPVGLQNIADDGADHDHDQIGNKNDQPWRGVHGLLLPETGIGYDRSFEKVISRGDYANFS